MSTKVFYTKSVIKAPAWWTWPSIKQVKFIGADGEEHEGLEFEWLASTPALDKWGDIVMDWAFDDSLKEFLDIWAPMLLQHNHNDPIWNYNELRTWSEWLFVKGIAKVDRNNLFKALRTWVLCWMSIWYSIEEGEFVEQKDWSNAFEIKKLRLHEISVVSVWMNQEALIKSFKDEWFKNLSDKDIKKSFKFNSNMNYSFKDSVTDAVKTFVQDNNIKQPIMKTKNLHWETKVGDIIKFREKFTFSDWDVMLFPSDNQLPAIGKVEAIISEWKIIENGNITDIVEPIFSIAFGLLQEDGSFIYDSTWLMQLRQSDLIIEEIVWSDNVKSLEEFVWKNKEFYSDQKNMLDSMKKAGEEKSKKEDEEKGKHDEDEEEDKKDKKSEDENEEKKLDDEGEEKWSWDKVDEDDKDKDKDKKSVEDDEKDWEWDGSDKVDGQDSEKAGWKAESTKKSGEEVQITIDTKWMENISKEMEKTLTESIKSFEKEIKSEFEKKISEMEKSHETAIKWFETKLETATKDIDQLAELCWVVAEVVEKQGGSVDLLMKGMAKLDFKNTYQFETKTKHWNKKDEKWDKISQFVSDIKAKKNK